MKELNTLLEACKEAAINESIAKLAHARGMISNQELIDFRQASEDADNAFDAHCTLIMFRG
jgi:hypothetical protein